MHAAFVVCWLSLAADDPRAKLTEGLRLVDSARFEQAVPVLRSVLSPVRVKGADLKKARVAYAQALYYTGQKKKAKTELRLLFEKFPTASADPAMAPDFAELFAQTKAAAKPGKAATEPKPPSVEAKPVEAKAFEAKPADVQPAEPKPVEAKPEPPPVEQPIDTKAEDTPVEAAKPAGAPKEIAAAPASTEAPVVLKEKTDAPAYVPAPWYLKILPFGIGQFANKDPAVGTVLLLLEAGLLATNIAMAVLMRNAQNPDGTFKPGTNVAYYATQQASAGALYVVLGFGLLDAFLWSPKRGAAR